MRGAGGGEKGREGDWREGERQGKGRGVQGPSNGRGGVEKGRGDEPGEVKKRGDE